jgi:hypothetical protein
MHGGADTLYGLRNVYAEVSAEGACNVFYEGDSSLSLSGCQLRVRFGALGGVGDFVECSVKELSGPEHSHGSEPVAGRKGGLLKIVPGVVAHKAPFPWLVSCAAQTRWSRGSVSGGARLLDWRL